MFDIGAGEILTLLVAALLIFGPDKLPKIAAEAGKMVRTVRGMLDNAKRDITDNLGPEFSDFDVRDLNPRTFVTRRLLDDDADDRPRGATAVQQGDERPAPRQVPLQTGERAPYDDDAT